MIGETALRAVTLMIMTHPSRVYNAGEQVLQFVPRWPCSRRYESERQELLHRPRSASERLQKDWASLPQPLTSFGFGRAREYSSSPVRKATPFNYRRHHSPDCASTKKPLRRSLLLKHRRPLCGTRASLVSKATTQKHATTSVPQRTRIASTCLIARICCFG